MNPELKARIALAPLPAPATMPTVSTNPIDALREGLAGRSGMPLGQLIQNLRAAGLTGRELAVIFGGLGIRPEAAAQFLGAAVGVLGKSDFINDYAAALDGHDRADFIRAAGKSGGMSASDFERLLHARYAATEQTERMERKLADHFGSLSSQEAGHVLGSMLFSAGHEAFWDQMVVSGQIHQETADHGKQMAARLPAEEQKQKHDMEAAIDGADLSPEDRAKAEAFKSSKKAKELADQAARIKLLKEHEEEAKRNGDLEYAKRVEEERRRMQERYAAQVVVATTESPGLRQVLLDQAPISPEQRQAAYRSEASSDNATVAALAGKLAVGDVRAADRLVQESEEARRTVIKAMIAGTDESKSQAALDAGVRAVAIGEVSIDRIKDARDEVKLAESAKVAPLAMKGQTNLRNDDDGDFLATPSINVVALDKMRVQKEETAPAPVKTASMQA